MLHPKTLSGPTQLEKDGHKLDNPQEIQDAFLDHRIGVWCHPASVSIEAQSLLIERYIDRVGDRCIQMPIPTI